MRGVGVKVEWGLLASWGLVSEGNAKPGGETQAASLTPSLAVTDRKRLL